MPSSAGGCCGGGYAARARCCSCCCGSCSGGAAAAAAAAPTPTTAVICCGTQGPFHGAGSGGAGESGELEEGVADGDGGSVVAARTTEETGCCPCGCCSFQPPRVRTLPLTAPPPHACTAVLDGRNACPVGGAGPPRHAAAEARGLGARGGVCGATAASAAAASASASCGSGLLWTNMRCGKGWKGNGQENRITRLEETSIIKSRVQAKDAAKQASDAAAQRLQGLSVRA